MPSACIAPRLRRRRPYFHGLLVALLGCGPAIADSPLERLQRARLPADSPAEAQAVREGLQQLTADDVQTLCKALQPAETGGDDQARRILHGLTLAAMSPGGDALKSAAVNGLVSAWPTLQPAVRPFVIEQWLLLADPAAVSPLKEALADPALCPLAAQALQQIGALEARAALREAAASATGDCLVAIESALGALHDEEAFMLLRDQAATGPEAARRMAVRALADIGSLYDARVDVTEWFAPSELYFLQLRNQQYVIDTDHNRDMRPQLVESLAAFTRADGGATLAGLAMCLQASGAPARELLLALADENPAISVAAQRFAAAAPGAGVTKVLVEEYPRCAAPVKVAILNVLGQRGDRSAASVTLGALAEPDREVRKAAVVALARLAQSQAIPQLVATLEQARDDAMKEAVLEALSAMSDAGADAGIAAHLDSAPASVQTTLLTALARRRAHAQAPQMLKALDNPDASVRVAAAEALQEIGGPELAPELIARLPAATGPVRSALEAALIKVCRREPDPAKRARPLLDPANDSNEADWSARLRILARVGGEGVFEALLKAARDPRPTVADAAYEALGAWREPRELDALIELARQTEDSRRHVLVLRAVANLLGASGDDAPTRLAQCRSAYELARRDEERRLILASAGAVCGADALNWLAGLESSPVRDEAALASLAIAQRLLPGRWPLVAATAKRIAQSDAAETVRSKAAALEQQAAAFEGFVLDWRWAGPFTQPGASGLDLITAHLPPEDSDFPAESWKALPAAAIADGWRVDVSQIPEARGDQRAVYLATYIHCNEPHAARLELGSDDGVKVWLNEQFIHTFNKPRGCERGADIVPVRLKAGWNRLVLKIGNLGGAFCACCRVRADDGAPLPDFRVSSASDAPSSNSP